MTRTEFFANAIYAAVEKEIEGRRPLYCGTPFYYRIKGTSIVGVARYQSWIMGKVHRGIHPKGTTALLWVLSESTEEISDADYSAAEGVEHGR